MWTKSLFPISVSFRFNEYIGALSDLNRNHNRGNDIHEHVSILSQPNVIRLDVEAYFLQLFGAVGSYIVFDDRVRPLYRIAKDFYLRLLVHATFPAHPAKSSPGKPTYLRSKSATIARMPESGKVQRHNNILLFAGNCMICLLEFFISSYNVLHKFSRITFG